MPISFGSSCGRNVLSRLSLGLAGWDRGGGPCWVGARLGWANLARRAGLVCWWRFVLGLRGWVDLLKPETEIGLLENGKVVSRPKEKMVSG